MGRLRFTNWSGSRPESEGVARCEDLFCSTSAASLELQVAGGSYGDPLVEVISRSGSFILWSELTIFSTRLPYREIITSGFHHSPIFYLNRVFFLLGGGNH